MLRKIRKLLRLLFARKVRTDAAATIQTETDRLHAAITPIRPLTEDEAYDIFVAEYHEAGRPDACVKLEGSNLHRYPW